MKNIKNKAFWFAAVGNDGSRRVVWGMGSTEDKAMDDARTQDAVSPNDLCEMQVRPITASQRDVVEAGDVSWPVDAGAA